VEAFEPDIYHHTQKLEEVVEDRESPEWAAGRDADAPGASREKVSTDAMRASIRPAKP
jgi:hypothetical protein